VANELQNLLKEITKVVRSDKVMRTALTTVLAIHKPRIHDQGKDASGNKIGTYSTKPISIAKNKQARNTGKTKFEGGYAEYKSAIGKNPGYVNLINTGQMQSDYGLVVDGDKYGFGFQNSENFNKSQWLQDKYNKGIYDLTPQELDLLQATLKAQVEGSLK
jgi:hypothetical protein